MTAFAVLAFFVPASLAMRSRIQRGELLELQREASIVASRISSSGSVDLVTISRAIDPDHVLAVYGPDGTLVAGDGPAQADDVVRDGLEGTFAEGYVGGDLVAAVPVRPGADGPGLVVRIREPARRERRAGARERAAAGRGRRRRPARRRRHRRAAGPPAEPSRRGPPASGPPSSGGTRPGRRRHRRGSASSTSWAPRWPSAGDRIRELLQRERSFSSHVAHQLRTPVAAMRVAVEAELDTPRPDSTEVLHECLRALDRLESTIESMLALARHDEREPSWCDVAALVREHIERWRPSYAVAGRDIVVEAGTHLGLVDAVAVSHILDVLLDNALVHGRGAGRRAGAARRWPARGRRRATTGRSRPDADPFSERRADASHGIGLRLARTLAESEGGHLGLLDAGPTVFRLTLPVPA